MSFLLSVSLLISSLTFSASSSPAQAIGLGNLGVEVASPGEVGFLLGRTKKEQVRCPLKHTDVSADVSGFVSSVTVKQQFHNPFNEKIEAIYTFPLPENSAVNQMTMKIGKRVIRGSIKERDEARDIYEAARLRGSVASLLDQERPNVFTQTVANIEPGESIEIEIKYVNVLKYEAGKFHFAFPTVVAQRFIPGVAAAGGSKAIGLGEPVADAPLLNPPSMAEGQRAGHDIAIRMKINSPVDIGQIGSDSHDVLIEREGTKHAKLVLKSADKIPNRDFTVSWNVASSQVRSGYLASGDANGGFFALSLIPPKRIETENVAPKEMIFLVDCSGSQAGVPMQKAKETLRYILDHMNSKDTFQIVAFNQGEVHSSAKPEIASPAMKSRAINYIDSLKAQGGTWMAPAVEKILSSPKSENRLRIVTFMTDGKVGNDFQVIDMIKRHRGGSRWFAFGTGDSVNRFLIDKIATEGGGEAEYVSLRSSAEEVGRKFYERISSPVLTDLKVEFQGLSVKDVYPREVADLWAQKPLQITGRYLKPGRGKAILTGLSAGKPYRQEVPLNFAEKQAENQALKSIWARAKVDRLMSENWSAMQFGLPNSELRDEIVATALKYQIMSQFTSFVAVEDNPVTADGVPRTDGPDTRTVRVSVESSNGYRAAEPFKRSDTARRSGRSDLSRSVEVAAPASQERRRSPSSIIPYSSSISGPSGVSPRSNETGLFTDASSMYLYAKPAHRLQHSQQRTQISHGNEGTAASGSPTSIPGAGGAPSASFADNIRGTDSYESPLSKNLKGFSARSTHGSVGSHSRASSKTPTLKKVRVYFKSKPDDKLIAKLKQLGFEFARTDGLVVHGSIRSDLIAELSRVKGIIKVEAVGD